jgi:hypothetical protein
VLGKRRIQYEEELAHDGRNYDVWFDYARLEEGAWRDLKDEGATQEEEEASAGRVREVYERAVAQVPPGGEKRHWRRYIFLWLDYALFEEIETKVCYISSHSLNAHSKLRPGLHSCAANIPNSHDPRPAQAVHVRKTLAHVCQI